MIAVKRAVSLALAGALMALVGCASASKRNIIHAIGPLPTEASDGRENGSLEVYSARSKLEVGPNVAERLWDENRENIEYLEEQPHTDYLVYAHDGHLARRVHNVGHPDLTQPALITLRPGHYEIRAECEDAAGETARLRIPVVVRPGKRTAVHLEGSWEPPTRDHDCEIVRLPNGQIAGWLAGLAH